jgi:hypothetical protein
VTGKSQLRLLVTILGAPPVPLRSRSEHLASDLPTVTEFPSVSSNTTRFRKALLIETFVMAALFTRRTENF